MPYDPLIKEYLDFMEWFQKNYPLTNSIYWKAICIPKVTGEITLRKKCIREKDSAALKKIVRRYYRKAESMREVKG